MKKIFSILFALVLVLSFSLVTAVPVSAYSVHNMSLDSNDSWTCEDADTLIWAKVAETGMSFDDAAATFASGNTNCEIKNLAVPSPAVVGSPVTITATVDMTAWVQCIGWNYYGVRVFAESLGYARVIDTGGSEVASVQSPWKWSDHWYGVDEHHWWFHVDTNDESQVWDFSITFTPTHTGEYTLFAGGRVNAGYWSDVEALEGACWFPHPDPDYGQGGGVTVGCEDSLDFEVGSILVDIDHAKLDLKKKPDDDKVRVKGKLALANGYGVDISEHVIVTVGPLSDTITMEKKGKKGERWEYKRPKHDTGDIKHMTVDWKNGKFDIRMDKADLSGLTNPVTISIQIGDDVGSASILMREKKHHWDYKAH